MIQVPNHTQVPNSFMDDSMRLLKGSSVQIFLVMCRKTIGWHKACDKISYSQLIEYTGLGSQAVNTAIAELLKHDLITVKKESGRTSVYSINYGTTLKIKEDLFENQRTTSLKIKDTKETLKETTRKKKEYAPTVHMTEKEYRNLMEKYGKKTTSLMIDKLSAFKGAKGKTYKNDYKAILSWVVDWAKKERYLTDRSGEKEYESELSCEDKMREIFSGR